MLNPLATEQIRLDQKSHYQRASSGFITLGGNEYALSIDRFVT